MRDQPDIRVAQPGESGRDHIIVSPFQFYMNGEDALRVTSANSLTGVVLAITGRFFDADTQAITAIDERHTPNTDRSIKQTLISLGKGYLLNIAVRVVTGAPVIGQTFAIVELVRGFTGATQFLGVLGQDYVTKRQGLAWPGSPIRSSIEGGGYFRTIAGAAPAAGAEILETVPAGARWELLSGACVLTTSATAGTRIVGLLLKTGGVTRGATFQPTGLIPSRIGVWYMGQTLPNMNDATGNQNTLPLPAATKLLAADTWGTQTQAIAAGDQWNAPNYHVQEWLEVN